jgi:hypothetical protein
VRHKRFRFRIASLLILTLVCAIGLTLARPFKPAVEFSKPVAATYTGVGEVEHLCCHVTVTNQGVLPIWVAGHSGLILSFAYQGNPASGSTENLNWTHQTPVYYTPLYRGQSAIACVPRQKDYKTFRLGVQFQDWRGRTADRWSDDFVYP